MKRKSLKNKFKKILFVVIFVLVFIFSIKQGLKFKNIEISNEEFLKMVINDSQYVKEKNGLAYQLVHLISKIENPINFFKNKYDSVDKFSASDDLNNVQESSEYISDPFPDKKIDDPIVYIYNTHQLEEYSSKNLDYDVKPNVMMASYILREKLYNNGINALVEDNNVENILNINNWNYASSYKVTRLFMEDAYSKNPSLEYFIDLHRDSVSKNISTATINDKKYAKILFIVGLENENYKENLALTEKLNSRFESIYPTISRGIYKKQGPGVNGVYNQDFNPNTILIEIGGEENTIDEVLNTVIAISDILTSYIKGE